MFLGATKFLYSGASNSPLTARYVPISWDFATPVFWQVWLEQNENGSTPKGSARGCSPENVILRRPLRRQKNRRR